MNIDAKICYDCGLGVWFDTDEEPTPETCDQCNGKMVDDPIFGRKDD